MIVDRQIGPTLGRAVELAVLRGALAATAAGTGRCVILTGAAGIGKTHLIEVITSEAAELGLAVASGQAAELDRVRPLTTLVSALRQCQPKSIDLASVDDEAGDRFGHLDRLGAALEAYAARQPLVIAIDDVQWTDEFSVLALRLLVPALASSPVLWLLARRPVPAHTPAQEAVEWLIGDGARQVNLGPLDEEAITQLCSQVVGAQVDATVLALAGRSGGNPFIIGDLLTGLQSANQLVISDGTATVIGDELPSGFLAAVDKRLRGLSAQAGQLLRAGSVLGQPFTIHAAAALAGFRAPRLVPAVDEVVAAGLLLDQDTRLAFRHDLLREAVYNSMSEPVRATLHREAAAVVQGEGGSAMEVAEHLMRSGRTGDREAVDLLRTAATEVAGRAPATAADLMMRALGMLPQHDRDRPSYSADTVGLLASAGRLTEATELGEAALRAGLDSTTEATLLLGLTQAFKHAGLNSTAVQYADRGLSRPGVPDSIRARLYGIQAHALIYTDDLPRADAAGAEAERLGTSVSDFSASVSGSTARSMVARTLGRLDDALAHASHAVEVADLAGGEAVHRHPRIWLGGALVAVDRFAEAEVAFITGRREAEHLGTAWSQPLWHYHHAALLCAGGRLDEAVAEAEAGLHITDQVTGHQLAVPLLGMLARLAILRAETAVARSHVRRMGRLLNTGITAAPEDVAWTIALSQEASGDPQSVRTLADIYDRFPGRLLLLSHDPGAAATLVRAAMKAGDSDRALATVGAARQLAKLNPEVATIAGAAAHAEGLWQHDTGALRRSVEHYRHCPRPLALASALEDLARAEQEAGRRAQAVELLEEARDTCQTCGARRATERLDGRLRTLGLRQRRNQTGAEAIIGGLTEAEWRVAVRVADGMTNREVADQLYLSPHTVDSHLRHIFTKLAINSRVELTRRVMAAENPPR